jgi:fluoride exporter
MSGLVLWLGVGALGGVAAVGRFLLDGLISTLALSRFPMGTLAVNLSGTILLGLLVGIGLHGDAYLLAGTAVIGSYTTFSTWLLESHRLAEEGGRWIVVVNLSVSLVFGVAAAALGRMIGGG